MSFEPKDRLDGRVAVITGGKGAIGLASARRLAALGVRIVSLDRSDPAAVRHCWTLCPPLRLARTLPSPRPFPTVHPCRRRHRAWLNVRGVATF